MKRRLIREPFQIEKKKKKDKRIKKRKKKKVIRAGKMYRHVSLSKTLAKQKKKKLKRKIGLKHRTL